MAEYISKEEAFDVACAECEAGTFFDIPAKIVAIPVPPHGRLIDADAFEEENAYFWNRDFINPKYSDTLADLVNDAPTIIPAEGGET